MGLKEIMLGLWEKEIKNQVEGLKVQVSELDTSYTNCGYCGVRYGLMDFHDCLGKFDAYRIVNGVSTNSVRARFRKKYGIHSDESEKLMLQAADQLDFESAAAYRDRILAARPGLMARRRQASGTVRRPQSRARASSGAIWPAVKVVGRMWVTADFPQPSDEPGPRPHGRRRRHR